MVADIAKLTVGREAYYTRELATDHQEYLSGHGESPGRWYGNGDMTLGLQGEASVAEFQAMFEGRDPTTGELLGRSHGRNAVAAFDVVLRPTKSVSILYGLADPATGRAVLQAHHVGLLVKRSSVSSTRFSTMVVWLSAAMLSVLLRVPLVASVRARPAPAPGGSGWVAAGALDDVGGPVVLAGLPDDWVPVVLAAVVDGHPDLEVLSGSPAGRWLPVKSRAKNSRFPRPVQRPDNGRGVAEQGAL